MLALRTLPPFLLSPFSREEGDRLSDEVGKSEWAALVWARPLRGNGRILFRPIFASAGRTFFLHPFCTRPTTTKKGKTHPTTAAEAYLDNFSAAQFEIGDPLPPKATRPTLLIKHSLTRHAMWGKMGKPMTSRWAPHAQNSKSHEPLLMFNGWIRGGFGIESREEQ